MVRHISRYGLLLLCLFLLSCPAGKYDAFKWLSYQESPEYRVEQYAQLRVKDSSLIVKLGYYHSHIKAFTSGLYIYLQSDAKDSVKVQRVIQSIRSSRYGDLVPAYEPAYNAYVNLHRTDSMYRVSYLLLPRYEAMNSKKPISDTITVNLLSGESLRYLRPY